MIEWTPEQNAVFEFALGSTENGVIEALAGAAKSTTLVELARRVIAADKHRSILIVAFNARIAKELRDRDLPPGVEARTTHSHGFAALRSLLGSVKARKPNPQKRTRLLRDYIQQFVKDADEIAALNERFEDIREAIFLGVNAGWIPDREFRNARSLFASDDEFFETVEESLEWRPAPHERAAIRTVSIRAIKAAFILGDIDFGDMLLIPTLFPASFPAYDLTLVDEAQDLTDLQHAMLRKMVGDRRRIIAVGDSCQAIYGFRGAHANSMNALAETFRMTRLTLSTSFRCPAAVAEHVRWRAPSIASPSWAKQGEVVTLAQWSDSDVPDGAAIICRNNAPLFSMALRLLRAGRRPMLSGNDIIHGLIRDMQSLSKDLTIDREEALRRLETWFAKMRTRYNDSQHVHDKYECIKTFLSEQETLGLAIAQAERIEKMTGTITLCTGHKSKGLEWPIVFFLDEHLINPKRDPQANNLRYVIATRAKERLIYVTSEGWIGPDFALAPAAAAWTARACEARDGDSAPAEFGA